MPRGGYRPGSGRKKGSKDKGPRKQSEEQIEAAKVRELLSYGQKAKLKIYNEFIWRASGQPDKSGRLPAPLSTAEKNLMNKLGKELAEELPKEETPGKALSEDSPLEYMLQVMRDPKADPETRLRAASLAAPYLHPRAGDGPGKKEDAKERAKRAASGIFAPGKPPKLEVVRK